MYEILRETDEPAAPWEHVRIHVYEAVGHGGAVKSNVHLSPKNNAVQYMAGLAAEALIINSGEPDVNLAVMILDVWIPKDGSPDAEQAVYSIFEEPAGLGDEEFCIDEVLQDLERGQVADGIRDKIINIICEALKMLRENHARWSKLGRIFFDRSVEMRDFIDSYGYPYRVACIGRLEIEEEEQQ